MPRSVKQEVRIRRLLGNPGPNSMLQDETGQMKKYDIEIVPERIDIFSEPSPFREIIIIERSSEEDDCKSKPDVKSNREIYLKELRSGKWKKGCIKSDEKGNPIIETPEDDDGACACGIIYDLFPKPDGKKTMLNARTSLGITRQDCVQHGRSDERRCRSDESRWGMHLRNLSPGLRPSSYSTRARMGEGVV